MIHDLKPYSAYKDSGVPWLGAIPSHWEMQRAKWLFHKMDRPVSGNSEVVTCFRDGIVTLRKNRRIRGFTESIKEIGYQGIRRGDLVIHAMDAFAGAVGVADSDGKGTPVYSVCEPSAGVSAHYYAYVIREMARSQWIVALAKGIRERSTDFRFDDFASQSVSLPTLQEQSFIVRFLESADRRIQSYIRAKKKLISLLNEQKRAIIHRTVTRGLDFRVCLKPSGVEWLGDVPEHWRLRKLRECGVITGGLTPSMEIAEYWGGDIPWVTPKDMKSSSISDSSIRITDLALQRTALSKIDAGSVLLVVRGMILARRVPIAWTTKEVTINQDMKALKLREDVSAQFLAYSLDSAQEAFKPLIDEAGHGTRRLPTERWRELVVVMPPLEEQLAINELLERETARLNVVISRAEREMELLYGYRARLIADVVTGKLDVREAAGRLLEEEPEQLDGGALVEAEEQDKDTDFEADPEEAEE